MEEMQLDQLYDRPKGDRIYPYVHVVNCEIEKMKKVLAPEEN